MKHPAQKQSSLARLAILLLCALPLCAQDAQTWWKQALTAPTQESQMTLFCKAADLDPMNKEYRRDCDTSKAALIAADKASLKTAQEANDRSEPVMAKRYAGYVSSLDPDLHKQAKQLLDKLSSRDQLLRAMGAYNAGDLQGAKAAGQSVTDFSYKEQADRIVANIDQYSGFIAAGRQHEQAQEYARAEQSYQSALNINLYVAPDNVAAKVQQMHQLASTIKPIEVPKIPINLSERHLGLLKPPGPLEEKTLEEEKKQLLDDSESAIRGNDLEAAAEKLKQVLGLDPVNAEAKLELARITTALERKRLPQEPSKPSVGGSEVTNTLPIVFQSKGPTGTMVVAIAAVLVVVCILIFVLRSGSSHNLPAPPLTYLQLSASPFAEVISVRGNKGEIIPLPPGDHTTPLRVDLLPAGSYTVVFKSSDGMLRSQACDLAEKPLSVALSAELSKPRPNEIPVGRR